MVQKAALIFFIFLIFVTHPAFAESSVNIPVHHWAYDDLDVLQRAGLTDGPGLISKPITRMDAARLIEQAIYRIQNNKVEFSAFDETKSSRAENALNRLVEEFRAELVALGVKTVAKDDQELPALRFRLADPVYTQSVYADLENSKDLLYENQRGWRLRDGFNYRTRIAGWAEYKDFIAVAIEPVAVFSDAEHDLEVETGYVKLSFWNVEVEAGRDTLWWGPGYHGSMLLSDNAYPLDLVKISNAHPFTLPWEYENLGKWNIDFFLARLEEKRDWPHAKLCGLRVECSPCDYFTFGLSRTVIFGGSGRPHYNFSDYVDMFTTWGKRELSQTDPKNADQLAAVDFRLNLPWNYEPLHICNNVQIYGEWAGEDKFAPWENEAPGYIAGLFVSDAFNTQDLDFRTEYAHNNASWYKHGIYTSGYKYKGETLGHHMGGDASDFFIRLSKDFTESQGYFERFTLGGQFDYEINGRSLVYPQKKYEPGIDGEFYLADGKAVGLAYKYQAVSNPGNKSSKRIHNNIFEVEANIKF